MLFYRDFIADYKLKIILIVKNIHYKNIIKNAIDLYNVNSFAYEFKTYKVDLIEDIDKSELHKLIEEYNTRKSTLNKMQKITYLSMIADKYREFEEISLSIKYYQEALKIAQKIKQQDLIMIIKLELGRLYQFISKYKISEKYLIESESYFRKDIENYKLTLERLAFLYISMQKYTFAKEITMKLYSLSCDYNDKDYELASLNLFVTIYTRLNNEKVANEYWEEAIKLAQKLDYTMILGDLYRDKAIYYLNNSSYNESLSFCHKSLLHYKKINSLYMMNQVYAFFAQNYYFLNDYKKSLEYANKCYSFFKNNNIKSNLIELCEVMSFNYASINNQELAILRLKEALTIAKELNLKEKVFEVLLNIARFYSNEKSFEYLEEAEKISKKNSLTSIYISYSMIYLNINNLNKAYEYYNKARNIIEDSFLLDELYGEILLKDNKFNEALECFQKALLTVRKDNDLNKIISIELNLAKTYKELNDKLLANRFYNEVLNKLNVINKHDKRITEIKKDLKSL